MDINATKPIPAMTTAEFLAWPGDGSGRKFQLIDGEVIEMPPASATHGQIQARLATLLTISSDNSDSGLRILTEGAVIPALRALKNVRIPDLVGTVEPDERGRIDTPEPVLAVEILSPSNESDTRGNVLAYRSIPSMREIVVVHSLRIKAEVHRRLGTDRWTDSPELVRPGGLLRISGANLECPIEHVCRGTWLVAKLAAG